VCVSSAAAGVSRADVASEPEMRHGWRAAEGREDACVAPPETTQPTTGAESRDWMQDCLAVHCALMP